jgi:hypothetical protein
VADLPRDRLPDRDRLLELPTLPPRTPRGRERLPDRERDVRAEVRDRDLADLMLLDEPPDVALLRREPIEEVREADLDRVRRRVVPWGVVDGTDEDAIAAPVVAMAPVRARDPERNREVVRPLEQDRDLERLRPCDMVAYLGREVERARLRPVVSVSWAGADWEVDLVL